jgi:hypothetical protein
MSYIQVGMKNKKYFLAIFRFITIFLGGVEEGRGIAGRGGTQMEEGTCGVERRIRRDR